MYYYAIPCIQTRYTIHLDNEKLIQHKKWLKEYSLRTKLKKEQTGESSDVIKEKIKRVYCSFSKRSEPPVIENDPNNSRKNIKTLQK